MLKKISSRAATQLSNASLTLDKSSGEWSLSTARLGDMRTKADVRLMMGAVSLMFTIIFLFHKQTQAGKGQRATACSALKGGERHSAKRTRESERVVKAITNATERRRQRGSEGELSCLQTPRGSEQIESDGLLISQLTAPETVACTLKIKIKVY